MGYICIVLYRIASNCIVKQKPYQIDKQKPYRLHIMKWCNRIEFCFQAPVRAPLFQVVRACCARLVLAMLSL